MRQVIVNASSPLQARKWEFLWLCGLILSFAYELPIWHPTSYDRVNPRLFDLMFFVGVLTVLPNLRRGVRLPSLFRIWAAIVVVFCYCALAWTVSILPWQYGQFSLFFAAKYIEGLIVIYIAVKIPLDERQKRIIHRLVVCGGVFVALYSIPQYGSATIEWTISGGKTVTTFGRVIFGPLSRAYFHIGLFSVLSFAMTLSLVPGIRKMWRSWLWFGLAFFVAWPALACGSRAAIAGVAIVLLVSVFFRPILMRKCLALVILAACFIHVADVNIEAIYKEDMSLGLKRFETNSDSPNSILDRLMIQYSIDQYMLDGLPVPFVGAGFGVAPVDDGMGSLHYRVGYGIHNAYLFAFEQGGLMAFVLFFLFLYSVVIGLKMILKSPIAVDRHFALGMSFYMAFLLLNAFTGQGFWRGFETANFNTYVVLLLILATRRSAGPNAPSASLQRQNGS